MQKTEIGNPELDYLFDNGNSFADRIRNKSKAISKEYLEMSKLYDRVEVQVPVKGNVVEAEFIGYNNDSFLFEVPGYKDYIRVDNKQSESKYLSDLEQGEMVEVVISELNEKNYIIKGSVSELYESRAHADLKALKEGESVSVLVKAMNPAGYEVEIQNGPVTLPGFMPNTLAGINKLYDPSSIVGVVFNVAIESYSEKESTYIVSRRKYLQTLEYGAIKELNYEEVYTGNVTGTAPFGVFVEFNECLTGMIHKANLHPDWQNKIDEIKPGFEIEFYIKEVVRDGKKRPKIILTQILRETLWDNIKNGQVLSGVVKDTKQFGTLVSLDDETVGLIHTSELEKIKKRFEKGQEINVKVLSVDRSVRKIFLTVE